MSLQLSSFLKLVTHLLQAMLEARMGVEELPSWVFFPDKERAEWVNTMLKQVRIVFKSENKIYDDHPLLLSSGLL